MKNLFRLINPINFPGFWLVIISMGLINPMTLADEIVHPKFIDE